MEAIERKRGRPVEKIPVDIMAEVLHWLGEGKTLRAYCRQEGKPSYRSIYNWLDKDKDFTSRFAHARDLGEEVISQECLEIADDMTNDVSGELQMPNNVSVNRAKLRIETRLKLLAIWNPKKYGAKVDLNHGGSIDLGLAERMEKALERVQKAK